jgi:hypothetical protein
MVAAVLADARPGDVIVLLSNGAFGGAKELLQREIAARA